MLNAFVSRRLEACLEGAPHEVAVIVTGPKVWNELGCRSRCCCCSCYCGHPPSPLFAFPISSTPPTHTNPIAVVLVCLPPSSGQRASGPGNPPRSRCCRDPRCHPRECGQAAPGLKGRQDGRREAGRRLRARERRAGDCEALAGLREIFFFGSSRWHSQREGRGSG